MWTPGASFSEKGTGLKVEASAAGWGPFYNAVRSSEYPGRFNHEQPCLSFLALPIARRLDCSDVAIQSDRRTGRGGLVYEYAALPRLVP